MKQKSELLNDEVRSKEEEKRRRKEAVIRLKAQQRAEVRIINAVADQMKLITTLLSWSRSMHLTRSWPNLRNRNFKHSYQAKCST